MLQLANIVPYSSLGERIILQVFGRWLLQWVLPRGPRSLVAQLERYGPDSMVIVNSWFGLEQACPLPPLVRMVGLVRKQDGKFTWRGVW